ncbi:SDR family oxidoreductase [Gordonia sp. PKS22-38]|uniref:SDR family oxidoreductase n=1 Tax=Gordonia prachuapensis TaxID=3115651 RepID=A0ABU7MUD9_9ACTN|nr:SDR family oxidoreductase [Gordonia sp. PKS22-38]
MTESSLRPHHARMRGVVTGAGSGIGRSCVELFSRHSILVEAWDLQPEHRLESDGLSEVTRRTVDVTDEDSVRTAAAAAMAEGDIDFLVNSAGMFLLDELATVPIPEVKTLFDVNVVGTSIVTQSLLPALQASRGSVVNIASTVAIRSSASNSHYSASKAAVAHLTRCWARELAPRVRVNAVAPGPTNTPLFRTAGMTDTEESAMLASRAAANPMGRLGQPDEIADWIGRFAVEASWITGAVLPIDGGMSL